MLVPISWLKDYVEIEETDERLAEKLLFSGSKVENISKKDDEVVFDFEITPNRADCLSIIGIAREIAVLYNQDLKLPKPFGETNLTQRKKTINLIVKDINLCPYYSLGVVDNIEVTDSPDWLKKRLKLVGVRPINTVVDITNYVMIETGLPMHTFDFDKIKGGMVLRRAKEGEKVTTLDGVERTLNKDAIIIEDSEKIIDLAGLMGGQNSQVDENTNTIVLHVPIYNSTAIRKTSQHINLRSEASNRFEKQLDPNGHRYAFERALHLLKIETGGALASDIKSAGYPYKSKPFTVSVEKIQSILGVKISEEGIINILSGLGFEILPSPSLEEHKMEIRPPTWRPDIKITEDIAEEVGRIWGYNRFPRTLPKGKIPAHEDSFTPDWEGCLRKTLTSLNFSETYSHSMTNSEAVNKIGFEPKNTLKVQNRMTVDYEYMRPTLLIGLLGSVALNLNNFEKVSLFEIGRVFSKNINSKTKLLYQPKKLAAVTTRKGFQEIKSIVQELLTALGIKKYEFGNSLNTPIWSEESANLIISNEVMGSLGRIKPEVLGNFSILSVIYGFELDYEKLSKTAASEIKYKQLPKFPVVKEDLSIVVEDNVRVQEIFDSIKSLKESKIRSIKVGEVIPWKNKKSILLNFKYYNPKGTLTDREAAQIRKKITDVLKKNLKVEIRSK